MSAPSFLVDDDWWAVDLPQAQNLPARCPVCLSPGSRAVEVLSSGGDLAPLTAHYCDLCADELAGKDTRRLAWQLTSTLLCVALVTHLALRFGSLEVPLQGMAALVSGALAGGLLWLFDRRNRAPLAQQALAGRPTLLAQRRRFLEGLNAGTPRPARPPPSPTVLRWLVPGGAALLWLTALHVWGTAKVVVVIAGVEPGVLTIDHRKRALVPAAPEERPGPGPVVSSLGGRRHVALFRGDGTPVLQQDVLLWPTRTYIASSTPPSLCFFLETQEYGEAGDAHTLQRLHPPAPVWELPVDVDRWFTPTEAPADLRTSGGVRRALRLLPCPTSALAVGRR